jgi:hypothetical protein
MRGWPSGASPEPGDAHGPEPHGEGKRQKAKAFGQRALKIVLTFAFLLLPFALSFRAIASLRPGHPLI